MANTNKKAANGNAIPDAVVEAYAGFDAEKLSRIAQSINRTDLKKSDRVTCKKGQYFLPVDMAGGDQFLGLACQIVRSGKTLEKPIQISIKQLSQKTVALTEGGELLPRFGKVFKIETIMKDEVPYFVLGEDLDVTLNNSGTAYVRHWDNDQSAYNGWDTKNDYAYKK